MAWFRAPGNPGGSLKIRTASGRIATFETNVADDLQEVKCEISPIQNGTPWIDSNEVNKVPYIKRAVAGTATRIGNHLYDKLVGGTVAFNQQVNPNNLNVAAEVLGITREQVLPNGLRYFGTSGQSTNFTAVRRIDNFVVGHKYFVSLGNVNLPSGARLHVSSVDKCTEGVFSLSESTYGVHISQGLEVDFTVYPFTIDLTQMFGSTIADYIYSLEQATAGAGVAWFKALFPNDYYAYNAGELMSVKATAHVMKNASNQVIGNYALDSNLVLNGLFKLDANNKLYADGDTYESSGLVTRKLSSVTLDGNINPNNLGVTVLDNYTQVSYMPYINIGVGAHSPFLCDKHFIHAAKPSAEIKEGDIYNSGVASAPRMFLALPKTVTTAAEAVAWFANNPTTVLFYIATPTTESASPFTNPQVCDENGTEEYTDSRAVAIPVGHETYQANICEISGFDELNIKQSGQDTSEIAKLIRLEFDDTVYLAEVSCLNGVWKLKLLGAEVDLGDLNYSYNSTYHRFDCPTDLGAKPAPDNVTPANALCSCYKNGCVSDVGTDDGFFYIAPPSGNGKLRIVDSRYSDVVTFKAAVSGNKLVYELATPTEITLDETEQFEALLGVNNVWHDGNGNTEVKFLEVVRN